MSVPLLAGSTLQIVPAAVSDARLITAAALGSAVTVECLISVVGLIGVLMLSLAV